MTLPYRDTSPSAIGLLHTAPAEAPVLDELGALLRGICASMGAERFDALFFGVGRPQPAPAPLALVKPEPAPPVGAPAPIVDGRPSMDAAAPAQGGRASWETLRQDFRLSRQPAASLKQMAREACDASAGMRAELSIMRQHLRALPRVQPVRLP